MSTTNRLEVIRTAKQDEIMELSLEELERLSGLCETAFATKKKQRLEALETQRYALELQHRCLLEFEPKIKATFSTKPVKLNVGGMYFCTNLDNLLREEATYFWVLFGGSWEPKINPDDNAVFIDRDPTMFQVILNYMRDGEFQIKAFTALQIAALLKEVDYYQIGSLLRILNFPQFSPTMSNNVQLNEDNTVATEMSGLSNSYAISRTPFSPSCLMKTVKIRVGQNMLIGVASHDIVSSNTKGDIHGWFLGTQTGANAKATSSLEYYELRPGNVVKVKLDHELNVSFVVDGVDLGVVFPKVVVKRSTSLYLAVCFQNTFTGYHKGHAHPASIVEFIE